MRYCSIFAISSILISSFVHANSIKVEDMSGQSVAGIAVYLMAKSATDNEVSTPKIANVRQHDKQFAPYITIAQTGSKVVFENQDDITHHIYSAIGPKRFSFKLKKQDINDKLRFDDAGDVAMGCNIHDWMSGHLLVVDTPYFDLTNAKGKVDFADVPAGKYQLIVWHPQLNSKDNRQSVDITLPLTAGFNLTLKSEIKNIPEQKSLDDFDFLEGY